MDVDPKDKKGNENDVHRGCETKTSVRISCSDCCNATWIRTFGRVYLRVKL
jgi:hypothetical protein